MATLKKDMKQELATKVDSSNEALKELFQAHELKKKELFEAEERKKKEALKAQEC